MSSSLQDVPNSRVVAFPMYDAGPGPAAAFWQGLKGHMRRLGLEGVPEAVSTPDDLEAHWRDPALLLGQTCGYPLTRALAGMVQLVATPCYRAAGCSGPWYRSRIVVRAEDKAETLADLRGCRAAYNSRDSQSGYNCFRALVAPLARNGVFFGAAIETGSHRASIDLLRQGEADVAAIDTVSYALAADAAPERFTGLRTLGFSAAAPGLPYITGLATRPDELGLLRRALAATLADADLAPCRAAMRLSGFEILPLEAYRICLDLEAAAVAQGYPHLA